MPTDFFTFLNDRQNWTRLRHSLPQLTERRLAQARNTRLGTVRNNDFFEFVGDRVVNLICALLVAEDSFSPDQQVVSGSLHF
jgi:dsRNA-specific ribonuclease